jgi:GNAT superfamily N-acetyltransferase
MIRLCQDQDFRTMLAVINDAAQAYRGVIPADRWKEPYMPREELRHEIASGVVFWGYEANGELVGVMGIQDVKDVTLIRHAYVRTDRQRQGIGTELLNHLIALSSRPTLVGTWVDAVWAIRFYERHGFRLVSPEEKGRLLRTYWSIPERQVETSVVLADERWFASLQ